MNTEKLKNVKTIITHDSCPDGRASALILHDALPDAEIIFCQYGTPLHKTLEPKPGMLFCDFSPYVESGLTRAQTVEATKPWVDAGTIVLDHHKGTQFLVESFGENGVFADEEKRPGVSGAVLALHDVWVPLNWISIGNGEYEEPKDADGRAATVLERFAILVGIRDTWQKNDPRWQWACAQAAALMFWPWEKLLAAGVHTVAGSTYLQIGETLLQRDYERDTKTISQAHRFMCGDVSVMCFEGTHTSDIADRFDGDLVVGWHYLVEGGEQKIVFSTRSRGNFSCLDFAKANGGGGHKNAAGFKLSVKSDAAVSAQDYSPYEIVEKLVRNYLANR